MPTTSSARRSVTRCSRAVSVRPLPAQQGMSSRPAAAAGLGRPSSRARGSDDGRHTPGRRGATGGSTAAAAPSTSAAQQAVLSAGADAEAESAAVGMATANVTTITLLSVMSGCSTNPAKARVECAERRTPVSGCRRRQASDEGQQPESGGARAWADLIDERPWPGCWRARGDVSCVDIVRASLDRIAACDRRGPSLHAIITVNPRALDDAAACDRARALGQPTGALHGIPLVLKDNFHTRDLPTTSGVAAFAALMAPEDAHVVARLRAAGAVIVGKANMTELAYGGTSVSALGGQVRNPYDLTRTPGGSSGGTRRHAAATPARDRQRHRAVDPLAGVGLRARRPQADPRPDQPPRHRALQPDAGWRGPITGPSWTRRGCSTSWPALTPRSRDRARRGRRPPSYLEALDPDALDGARLACSPR